MSQPATRKGDLSSGHGAWAPRPADVSSPDVVIGGQPAVRTKDPWTIHCVGLACHLGAVQEGSETVIINGEGAVRIGDDIDCGGTVIQGLPTVIIGD